MSQAQREWVIGMIDAGMSVAAVSRQLNVHHTTLNHLKSREVVAEWLKLWPLTSVHSWRETTFSFRQPSQVRLKVPYPTAR